MHLLRRVRCPREEEKKLESDYSTLHKIEELTFADALYTYTSNALQTLTNNNGDILTTYYPSDETNASTRSSTHKQNEHVDELKRIIYTKTSARCICPSAVMTIGNKQTYNNDCMYIW